MTQANSAPRHRLATVLAGAILVAAVAGCGSDDDSTESVESEPAQTEETAAVDQSLLDDAVAEYDAYVEQETAEFVGATDEFVALVETGDLEAAKAYYPSARVHFERIEPVAGAFGDLDPDIDGREGDIPPAEWGGYHRIEKALWIEESTAGLEPIIKELVSDVANLDDIAIKADFDPGEIAQGSVDLLAEVSSSKITGEEERYSHTDLWDFEANVAGSEAGFEALSPALEQADADLVAEIESEFENLYTLLDEYRTGNGFVLYDTLDDEDTRQLAQQIDLLAERLSQVPAHVG